MSSKITMILELLGDGKWHGIDQLRQQMGFKNHEMQEIAAFLSRYDLADVDGASRRVKINRDFKKILMQNTTE